MVLWEELLVVGRLERKRSTVSDLPPTPVLLARAEVLATEVIRHLHLVPKDHAWHLSSPTHAHSLSSSSPTSCTRHAHRLETWRASNMGCLRRSGRRTRLTSFGKDSPGAGAESPESQGQVQATDENARQSETDMCC